MHRRLTTVLACAAALTLAACGSSSDTIAGTSPAIASAVCDGDDGCESDMRELSHKLDASDDADGNGIIDREELDAALERLDKEAEEKEAAASSSAAAASSSAAAASSSAAAASKSAEAEREAERKAAEREAAEREAAEREAEAQRAAEREAANQQQQQQQQAPEPAPQQQAPQQPSGPPAMEWATLGPYGSLFTCEQARDVWPVDSHACYTGSDGNAYFGGHAPSRTVAAETKNCPAEQPGSFAFGGANGIRTRDPHTASVVRYQLRHSPVWQLCRHRNM